MLQDRSKGVQNLALICQLALVSVGWWLWLVIYYARIPLSGDLVKQYLLYNEVLLIGLVFGFSPPAGSAWPTRLRWSVAGKQALNQLLVGMMGVFTVWIAFQERAISRLFLFSFIPILYVILAVSHRRLAHWIARLVFRNDQEQRILLVGSPEKALRLGEWLGYKQEIGLRTVGLLCEEEPEGPVGPFPRIGAVADLEKVISESRIDQVILTELPFHLPSLHHCIGVCEKYGVRFLMVSDLEEKFRHPVSFFEDGGRRFIELREEPLENPFNRMTKRFFDIAVAFPVVVLVLPVVSAVVWLLQRRQSPGPIFHRQIRAGMQNRPFRIYKYRTMHVHEQPQGLQAAEGDPRIYRAGRWLRKFSIDELPQFLNVLTGEMSVVGPRPHLIEHNEVFARALNNFHVRAHIKPGITGLAQIRGFRGATKDQKDIVLRVNSDIHYLERWSFAMDCYIVARTVGEVILPSEGAV